MLWLRINKVSFLEFGFRIRFRVNAVCDVLQCNISQNEITMQFLIIFNTSHLKSQNWHCNTIYLKVGTAMRNLKISTLALQCDISRVTLHVLYMYIL